MKSEHVVELVIPGTGSQILSKLSSALEKLGYTVLGGEPLKARRKGRKLGIASTNLLNYPMELEVGLKEYGDNSSRLTFYYRWNHTWGAIGDKVTLKREAEAIAALASLHARLTACANCGTEGLADYRFCRQCGSVLTAAEPAELEVLRLTAAANSAVKSNSFGMILGSMAVLSLVLMFIFPGSAMAFLASSAFIGIFVWIASLFAATRLAQTLDLKIEKTDELLAQREEKAFEPAVEKFRELNQAPASVVENSTELLFPGKRRETAKIPVERKREIEN
jgi:hypothetical protein